MLPFRKVIEKLFDDYCIHIFYPRGIKLLKLWALKNPLDLRTNPLQEGGDDEYCNIPGYPSSGPRGCQVTTAQCTPTYHPSPSIHTGWVVASGYRTPNLTFNTLPTGEMSLVVLQRNW